MGFKERNGGGSGSDPALEEVESTSSRIGEFFFSKSGSTVQGYLPVTPSTVINGAIDFPVWASMYPEFVSGNDIVFPADVEGIFLRNLGGDAAAEGSLQGDLIGTHSHTYNNTRVSSFDMTAGSETTESVSVPDGGTSVRARINESGAEGLSITNTRSTLTSSTTGGVETRPKNRAYQLYTIVDNYNEKTLAGLVTPTPLANVVYSLSDDASGIACPFDEGQGDTSIITNSGGTISLPVGKYRIVAHATRHADVLDYEIYDVTNSVSLSQSTVLNSSTASNGDTTPYYLTVTSPIDIQLREGDASNNVVWNGKQVGVDTGWDDAQPSFGCYIDIQQLPQSTVVLPEALEVEDRENLLFATTNLADGDTGTLLNGLTWQDVQNEYDEIIVTLGYPNNVYYGRWKTSQLFDATAILAVSIGADGWTQIEGITTSSGDFIHDTNGFSTAGDVTVYGVKAQKTVINNDELVITNPDDSGALENIGPGQAAFVQRKQFNTLAAQYDFATTTFESIPDLAFDVVAGETYLFEIVAVCSLVAASDIKMRLDAPDGVATVGRLAVSHVENAIGKSPPFNTSTGNIAAAATANEANADPIVLRGWLTPATSGVVQLFAGNNAGTATTSIHTGSWAKSELL